MTNLKDILIEIRNQPKALGHFNFSNLEVLQAIVSAAQNLNTPILVGTSEGEREFIGPSQAAALVKSFRGQGLPIFLNADHSKSIQTAKAAIEAGYDSIHFDGSGMSYEENLRLTKDVVDYARQYNPDISVEGELGYLRGSSELHQESFEIKPEDMTDPDQAQEFVEKTGIDRLAVVIGNLHGVSVKGNPRLDIERLRLIAQKLPQQVTITLHGGSGTPDQDIRSALSFGLSNIHVNTELRIAYTSALRKSLEQNLTETTPYHYLKPAREAAIKLVEEKLRLFGLEIKPSELS